MEDIEDLLVQIEEEVANGKRALFGSGVTVNGDVIYSLVDRIRAAVPDIMREAKAIVRNSEKRQQEESMRARNIVEQAQKRADEILANHNIIRQAEKEAEAIRAQATDFAKRVRADVMRDISRLLAESEAALNKGLDMIHNAQLGIRKEG